MTVPFLDLKSTYLELQTEIDAAYARVMRSGWYLLGEELTAFEQDFAAFCGTKHSIGVGNGLDALHLALRAMEVGPGDEVIVPSNTFIATWLAVSYVGATPVPVEPDPRTFNLDPARIEAAITERTKVILPVHLYGQTADMNPIMDLARTYGIRVLEDAAQAHGARYFGQRAGSLGDAAAWSFYPGKNLGAFGDGGAITTNNSEIADRVRMLRNYGSRVKYMNEIQGHNSRLDELHAAMLRVKLNHLDEWNCRRQNIACRYQQSLNELDLVLPHVPDWAEPVWHLFVIRSKQRDLLQEQLKKAGVATLIHYPIPPHLQEAYRDLNFPVGSYPISERIHREVLSLPIGPHLTEEHVHAVIHALRKTIL